MVTRKNHIPDLAFTEEQPAPLTKHNHQVVFGRRVAGCPRCAELEAGAEVRRPAWTERLGQRQRDDEQRSREMAAHFASEKHRTGGCGTVCTAFDW